MIQVEMRGAEEGLVTDLENILDRIFELEDPEAITRINFLNQADGIQTDVRTVVYKDAKAKIEFRASLEKGGYYVGLFIEKGAKYSAFLKECERRIPEMYKKIKKEEQKECVNF